MAVKKNRAWWLADETEAHKPIFGALAAVRGASRRPAALEHWLGVLRGRAYSGTARGIGARAAVAASRMGLDINVLINLVDTLCAHVTTMQPRPVHVPNAAGGWSVRRMCKLLDKWVLGLFEERRAFESLERVLRDAVWAGDGFGKVWHDGERVFIDRMWPGDIWVDDGAVRVAPPRVMFQVEAVPVELACARWPEHEESIMAGKRLDPTDARRSEQSIVEAVEIVHAWHLPSPGTEDGRYVIASERCDLQDASWKLERFPFVHMQWSKPEIGFYGIGLVEQQFPMQRAFSRTLSKIDDAIDINSMRVFAEEGSIEKSHMTNRPGDIVYVKKTAGRWPEVHAHGSVPADAYQHAWNIYAKLHETVGISELSATAKRPPAEMPGIAYRMQQDIERGRHGLTLRMYDRAVMDVAHLAVLAQRDLAEGESPKPEWSTHYLRGGKISEVIPWDDMPEEDSYQLSVWPASIMPATPAGQIATAQELVGAGFIAKESAMQILHLPDIDRLMTLENAYSDYIGWCAERMLMHGETHLPQGYDAPYLAIGILQMGRELLLARTQGAPEKSLTLLAQWISLAEANLRASNASQAAAPPPIETAAAPLPSLVPGGIAPPEDAGQGAPAEVYA